ncbi:MAG: hypothetical protein JST59_15510 [Actinobacteria bacterium]|nr:hypothetical protein [Actinomycetota bacterium]
MRVFFFSVAIALAIAVAGCGGGGSTMTSAPPPSRGIKGENPTEEAATSAHISPSDCAALGKLAEERLGAKLSRHSIPKPPLSRCRLEGPGTSINVYLDSGFAANQRYYNRIEETVQFNAPDPRKVPHPVAHVGEKSAYNSAASWIPNLRSLLAVRGNRWLTVTISVKGKTDRELRDEAAVLARAGFRLTAMG